MIKCEVKKDSITLDVSGTLDQITCDILMLVSALYEKMDKSDTPMMASLFRDALKKAFRDDVPFNVEDEPRNVMTDVEDKMISDSIIDDVMKDANDILGLLDEFSDYIKKRSKHDDKKAKD